VSSKATPDEPTLTSTRIGGRVNNVVAAGGHIWAGAFKRPRLRAIDPATARAKARPRPEIGIGLAGIAVVGDSMWTIASREHRLVRLDSRTGEQIGEAITVPGFADAVAADERNVWVAVSYSDMHSGDQILQYDARTRSLERTLNVLNGVRRLVLADGGLWMLGSTPARLARIDLRTGRRHRIRFEAASSGDLATGAGSLWLTLVDTDQLVRVNPRTWNVTTIGVGREPNGIVSRRGSIWVANRTSSTISRVDPRAGRVRDEIEVPLNPYELAADGNGIWVTSLATGRVTRVTPPARAG
jgi:streptogramin lyase